jgi:hypothetical protein
LRQSRPARQNHGHHGERWAKFLHVSHPWFALNKLIVAASAINFSASQTIVPMILGVKDNT